MPPSSLFSRLQDEQNLRLGDVSWVGVGDVDVVITESAKSSRNRYFTSFPHWQRGLIELEPNSQFYSR